MKMSGGVVSVKQRSGTSWWKRLAGAFGALTGLLTATTGAGQTSAAALGNDYRPQTSAPAAWLEFATNLQAQFQQRLAADDPDARKFREFMTKREGREGPLKLVVRTWILPSGKVGQIEFDGLDDDHVAATLRTLLVAIDTAAPPPDMLQPLRLRLSLQLQGERREGRP